MYATYSVKAGSVLLYRALPLMCPRTFQNPEMVAVSWKFLPAGVRHISYSREKRQRVPAFVGGYTGIICEIIRNL